MKSFIKIFAIAFVCFTLLFGGVVLAILKMPNDGPSNAIKPDPDPIPEQSANEAPEKPKKIEKTELQKLTEKSSRINVLLMGLEGTRTDTMILASFDPKSKKVDLISIPRDTYHETAGYTRADQKKINAVYGFKRDNGGGPEGVMKAVANILKVPIHHYVTMSYKGVENIVDSLGGVKVNIPFNMDYDDPYSKPPLHIHFKKGTRVLKGKDAIKFLRHRQNNDGTHSDGDIGRIKRQKQFVKSAAKSALNLKKLPAVARTVFKFVKTDMELDQIVYYATKAVGISENDIETYTLPGKPKGISYYIYDSTETKNLMIQIYKNGSGEQ
jgi:LCP family protein required for cell wall assembly